MKILIISGADNKYRGSTFVPFDIYDGLKRIKGNEVKVLFKNWNTYDDKNVITLHTFFEGLKSRFFFNLSRVIRRIHALAIGFKVWKDVRIKYNSEYIVQDIDQTITYYSSEEIIKKAGFIPDIIVVLFCFSQKFLSYKNLYEFENIYGSNIYIMPMDMATYTGVCHYAWDCTEYTKQCGNCPALYSNNDNDQSYLNWKFKKYYADLTNIHVIVGADLQLRQVKSSSLFSQKPIHKIFLPTDSDIFKPVDKRALRQKMGLPMDKKIIFFGSMLLGERRKGMRCLLDSLKILKEQLKDTDVENNILLLIAGGNIESLEEMLIFDYHYLGWLTTPDHTAEAYQAADVFVCPSIEDAGPTMINQSVMCGTPVVSFEMGVAFDLVITGHTGYRSKLGDVADLAKGIQTIINLDDPAYQLMSENCRNFALENFSKIKNAEKLTELFTNNRHEK